MVSSIAISTARQFISPGVFSVELNVNFKIRPRISFILMNNVRICGCKELKETRIRTRTRTRTRCGFSREGYSDSEAEFDLEREILMFMKNSKNPNEFPTKKQLLDAGRTDLVDAITKTRGWLAYGWDFSEDEDDDFRELQTRLKFQNLHQSSSTSSIEEDTGVEGILNRLEKHRSLSFDIHKKKNKRDTYAFNKDNGGFTDFKMSTDIDANINSQLQEKQRHNNNNNNNNNNELNLDMIKSRLQHMQLELSSAINSLRSTTLTLNPEVLESCDSKLQQLSDVWEFKENEVTKANDKLRSICAKLAVLEGKIALSVIDAHKLVVEKQRRIDSARKTLQLLRTTTIFWTHSASEVLLVGSFDGWTSQLKMEKTRTEIFSTTLKLYPGKYEIKFIVDGVWRVDPMLPVVHNNGYENNRLIVHE